MELRLFPLQTVLFPGMRMPLHIFEERYKVMIRECIEEDAPFGVLLIRSGAEVGGSAIPCNVGTTARISQVEYLDDGRMNIFTMGESRFRVDHLNTERDFLRVHGLRVAGVLDVAAAVDLPVEREDGGADVVLRVGTVRELGRLLGGLDERAVLGFLAF